jgi:hypothetical protein
MIAARACAVTLLHAVVNPAAIIHDYEGKVSQSKKAKKIGSETTRPSALL